jgi:hypothetical protein
MFVYLPSRSASSAPTEPHPRYSSEQWSRVRGAIEREHRMLAALDPRSPRIRPTVATLPNGASQ